MDKYFDRTSLHPNLITTTIPPMNAKSFIGKKVNMFRHYSLWTIFYVASIHLITRSQMKMSKIDFVIIFHSLLYRKILLKYFCHPSYLIGMAFMTTQTLTKSWISVLFFLRDKPLVVSVSAQSGFQAPINAQNKYIGKPYIYLGFIPKEGSVQSRKNKAWVIFTYILYFMQVCFWCSSLWM